MAILTAAEVFEFAVRVEENGERFYKGFADRFRDTMQRELFNYLAAEEKKHRTTFETFLKNNPKAAEKPNYPDEYETYLQAYAEGLIFSDPDLKKEIGRIGSVKEACEFGIRRELDSILYYQEIKNFVPEHERERIDDIITEERRHFIKLSEMKRELQ